MPSNETGTLDLEEANRLGTTTREAIEDAEEEEFTPVKDSSPYSALKSFSDE